MTRWCRILGARLLRPLYVAAGLLCVGLAALGVVLPLMPAIPFLLAAAACFARSSPRLHHWLFHNRLFGHHLRAYRAGAGMTRGAKVSALVVLWLSMAASAWLLVPPERPWMRAVMVVVALGVTVSILRLPTRRAEGPPAYPTSDEP